MRTCAIVLSLGLLGFVVSCQEPGHRIEVVAGQQGQTEIRKVPYTPEEIAQRERPRMVIATTMPSDPDLATLESLWPTLAPADRTAILDLAKRLSR